MTDRPRLCIYRPDNRRLKLHLGLVVPQPVRMRIGAETRSWAAGKVNFLDDSFEHEVWNDSGEERVVLEVIFDHPGTGGEP
jgi:aspartate beta-hydroxylase